MKLWRERCFYLLAGGGVGAAAGGGLLLGVAGEFDEGGASGVAGGEVVVLSVAAAAVSPLLPPASSLSFSAAFEDLLSRKSVTYQPDPLSWNPAAVTCFLKLGVPQVGQTVNSGSEIFCKTSF